MTDVVPANDSGDDRFMGDNISVHGSESTSFPGASNFDASITDPLSPDSADNLISSTPTSEADDSFISDTSHVSRTVPNWWRLIPQPHDGRQWDNNFTGQLGPGPDDVMIHGGVLYPVGMNPEEPYVVTVVPDPAFVPAPAAMAVADESDDGTTADDRSNDSN